MRFFPSILLTLVAIGPARAELVSVEWHTREPFAKGQSFGKVGAYERLVGVAKFAVDPRHARNKPIVDLENAPRNAKGLVEFRADVYILKPRDVMRGNGALLYDVNNRGNKLALRMFNDAPGGNDPSTLEHAGNGFLFRMGYTVVWCGWIGELLPGEGRMLLEAPRATLGAEPITGVVRHEMSADAATDIMPLSRRGGHGSYAPTRAGETDGVLTWRSREDAERVMIPRAQWSLQRKAMPVVKQGVAGTLDPIHLKVSGGFRPGSLYELTLESSGPIVQGLGFAAVRDLVSFLRHDATEKNPLAGEKKSAIRRTHGFGVSQSGRFLRHLLYQGFNVDERGRKVFDGLMPHVAGGGLGFFNHRFAQPNRHNGQHEDHLYPCDVFPFTYGDSVDDYERKDGGLRRRGRPNGIQHWTAKEDRKLLPRVMHTQSAAEYWHRSGSLVHTDTLGEADAEIPDNVRIYAFGGTQHGPASRPPTRGGADNLHNPADYRPFLRALLEALDAWVRADIEPPASVYPRIADGTLVSRKATGFPALPGVRFPDVIQRPSALDLGPKFAEKGIITKEPPRVLGHYRVLVPRTDADGNDLGTLLPIEVAVPLATYTGWNLRSREVGAEGMLLSLVGSYIPFSLSEAERVAAGDPRVSILKRYTDFAGYSARFTQAREALVKRRLLLPEDARRLLPMMEDARRLFPEEKTRRLERK